MAMDGFAEEIEVSVIGSNFKERGSHVLQTGLWADCKFIVGEDKKEITASKILLTIASPVFETMFFGSFANAVPIDIPDVKSEIFLKLLQYIYCHSVDYSSCEEAFDICSAAHQYMMPDLIQNCSRFLQNSLMSTDDLGLLCNALNFAMFYNIDDLKQVALMEVQEKMDVLTVSPELLTLSSESLACVLQQSHLEVKSESSLIYAAIRWATACCKERGLPVRGSTLGDILKEGFIFQQLRFLLMREEEIPFKSGIISSNEIMAITKHIFTNGNTPLPPTICPIMKPRVSARYIESSKFEWIGMERSYLTIEPGDKRSVVFEIPAGVPPFVLQGVSLLTQVYTPGSDRHSFSYDEDVEVTVDRQRQGLDGKRWISYTYTKGFHKGRVKYNALLHVPLEIELELSDVIRGGEKVYVEITFNTPGQYPLSVGVTQSIVKNSGQDTVVGLTYRT